MSTLFTLFEYAGIFAFGISGSILAVRKNMDLYGSMILALMTAMGGGLMRDIMIGSIPPLVLRDVSYVMTAMAGALTVYLLYETIERLHYSLRVLDAIGLGLFTVLGTQIAIDYGLPWFASVMIGVISGTGGGMIRDVLAREVPLVLQREIYAMAAFLGAAGYAAIELFLQPSEVWRIVSASLCAIVIALFRIISVYRDWHMVRAFHRQ